MNGPGHYQAAEELISEAETSLDLDVDRFLIAAQVHATLAVAAATVLTHLRADLTEFGSETPAEAWRAVIL